MTAERRLLRVITRLNVGGPARQALLLSRDLAGYDSVLAAGHPRPEEGELLDPAVPVRYVPLVREIAPRHDISALVAIRRLVREHRPHVVHTHMAKAGTLTRLAVTGARRRPVLVHTFHGHVLDGYFRPVVQSAFVRAERALARRTDVLIAVSKEIRDQLLELDIGEPSQYRVVPLGLELDRHRRVTGASGELRRALGVSTGDALVGVVGRLVPIKDHELLLRAFARVPDAHLAVIGDGELRSLLEARVSADPALAGRVHFAGWWLDMPAVLSDLDLVVLTSRNEGTPVALIEAGAAGRPVVSTAVGGVPSVVVHGETGLLVEPDEEAVAGAIVQLLGDADLRSRFGAAGREASRRFDAARLVADIAAAYDDALERR